MVFFGCLSGMGSSDELSKLSPMINSDTVVESVDLSASQAQVRASESEHRGREGHVGPPVPSKTRRRLSKTRAPSRDGTGRGFWTRSGSRTREVSQESKQKVLTCFLGEGFTAFFFFFWFWVGT